MNDGSLALAVRSPPVDGAANEDVCRFIADALGPRAVGRRDPPGQFLEDQGGPRPRRARDAIERALRARLPPT